MLDSDDALFRLEGARDEIVVTRLEDALIAGD